MFLIVFFHIKNNFYFLLLKKVNLALSFVFRTLYIRMVSCCYLKLVEASMHSYNHALNISEAVSIY